MISESSITVSQPGFDLRQMRQRAVIRDLQCEHLTQVARIHVVAFPDSALTRLGIEAVRRYYKWLLEGPHEAIRIGAFVDSEVVGFCFAGLFRGAMSGFLQANRLFLSSRVFIRPWVAANPIFRSRMLSAARILRRRKNRKPQFSQPALAVQKPFGILAIAVSPNQQGSGVGRLLMQESEAVARRRRFREMILTVSRSNDQAIRFYENLRWVKITDKGPWQGGMRKLLDVPTEPGDLPGGTH